MDRIGVATRQLEPLYVRRMSLVVFIYGFLWSDSILYCPSLINETDAPVSISITQLLLFNRTSVISGGMHRIGLTLYKSYTAPDCNLFVLGCFWFYS